MIGWSLLATLVSFVLTLVGVPLFIKFLKKAQVSGQEMQEEVLQHAKKSGTPTMGGVVFVIVSVLVALVFVLTVGVAKGNFSVTWIVLFLYAAVGAFDDFLKVFRHQNEGFKAWQKFLAQIVIGVLAYLFIGFPMGQDNSLNLFGFSLHLGILFIPFFIVWLVGWSNAVNLTDGIDGLATGSVIISLLAFAVIAISSSMWDVLIMIMSVIGALLGFLVFNKKPAMIFMGDVGSLALGAFLAAVSVVLRAEWTLLFIGLVYVIETLSIMIQVSYFKISGGKRVFRMAPIHHHLELGGLSGHDEGWSEWKIDRVFWLVTAAVSTLTVVAYLIF
ncbi:MAG: phospho-N-acetylmuramoyl-pentapeptide-transferase [Streptococcaceae bacterium]|jgi:phospho-N-acetylmuramoyl-pentapeptide-transferase|nr:phospho-N-acetylmuramoyl-pentapeptide-transferase [Streptococcaceae bacterium]